MLLGISIHAPAKGATPRVEYVGSANVISIHAPAKGATSTPGTAPGRDSHFNPRSREGSDTARPRPRICSLLFQSTLPRRERPQTGVDQYQRNEFQSTLPRRERRTVSYSITTIINFNPRSREGSDVCLAADNGRLHHFNPRSREGSDNAVVTRKIWVQAFQSTLPRRERRCRLSGHAIVIGFQSTLPRRERRCPPICTCRESYFNPRSREGSDVDPQTFTSWSAV